MLNDTSLIRQMPKRSIMPFFPLNVFKAYTQWLFIMYLLRSLRGLYSNEAIAAPNLADTQYL